MPALSPWPNWSQLDDWTADGGPDENRLNNCGPESAAECLKYLTGVELPADFIKDAMYGEAYTGYTDVGHLVDFLQRRCEVPVRFTAEMPIRSCSRSCSRPSMPRIRSWCCITGSLSSPTAATSVRSSPTIKTAAPVPTSGTAKLETWDWATFEKWQKFGIAIVLKRTHTADLTRGMAAEPLVNRMRNHTEARPFIERALARRAPAA